MPQHVFTRSWSNGSETLSGTITLSAEGEIVLDDIALTSSQTDKRVNVAFAFARLKAIVIDSTTDITIETNSSSAPDDSIDVTGGEDFQWTENDAAANPFTADVTDFYITNGEAAAGVVNIRILHDPTP